MTKYTTKQIKEIIIQESIKRGVDPAIMLAIAENESGFDPNAHNPRGENSFGLFQINKNAHPTYDGGFDPIKNTQWGIGIFKDALRRANGDVNLALRIYNGGYGGRNSKSARGYATRVAGLIGKHRNTTVPDSNYITNKARGVRMANKSNNSMRLEGQVSSNEISPVSQQGLSSLLDRVGAQTRLAEQRFRETINPSTKSFLIREMYRTGFNPAVLRMYVSEGGDLAKLKTDLNYGDTPAPWEVGGTPVEPYSEGLERQKELEALAYQRAQDELNLFNQINDPERRAAEEQAMRNRLQSSFDRYNQMVDNLQDPRLQNGGYYLDPDAINRGALSNAAVSAYFGQPTTQTPQQIAQARYEAQVANQYGVPYQQVVDAQMNKFNMHQALLNAQIEQDFAQEMKNARSSADVLQAQQNRINNYYRAREEAIKARTAYDDTMLQGYIDVQKARVAPTITGSSGILQKGIGVQGELLNTDLANQYGLQKQTLANEADINKANIEAQARLTERRMQLEDPWEQAVKAGKAVAGFTYGAGMNPIMTGQLIEATPFGKPLFPTGTPQFNMNAGYGNNLDNTTGGLRVNQNPPFNL